jgi:hypothetical protein
MNASRSLEFVWTSWSLAISIFVLLVATALGFAAWRRSGYRTSHGLLELLRWSIVAFGVILINQPEFTEEYRSKKIPSIAVLCDVSPSMQTADVFNQSGKATRRATALRPLLESSTWKLLEERMHVVLETFSKEAGHSDLFQAMTDTLNQQDRLLGVVLASDGDWNAGRPPVEAAMRMRISGVPLLAVPVGSPIRLPDVELTSLDSPTFGVAGKSVRIPFTIESSLPREHTASVVLRTSDGDELQTEVQLSPMGRTSDAILWKPSGAGDMEITLTVSTHPDEIQEDNNQRTAPISIREEKLRVLLVEAYPRWEYRYLRNALSRDPGIELSCLLFHPDLGKVGGGNKDYIKSFPKGLDELGQFDVVFLGDVGMEENQLSSEDCRLLKGIVQYQASGLVFMPGWQGHQASLLDSELAELYPVLLDRSQPTGWGSRTPSHFELTQLGQRSLLTKLTDDAQENIAIWDDLPGFQWYAAVERARPGSEVLCVHRDNSNQYGRIPLLATRTFGTGKVLFMGTDGAWRWRKGVEDKYHYRFWGQVVRWMAYQRNMAKGESMRLYYSPDQPHLNRQIALNANVMEPTGEPLQKGDVLARITAPSGKVKTVRLQSTGDEWGAFAGEFVPTEPGPHQVTLGCRQTNATLETLFYVHGIAEERPGRPARPEVMEELARVTQGKVLDVNKLEEIIDVLSALPDPPPAIRRVQLWSHPLVGAAFVVLVGAFWIGRKAVGLI